MKIALIHTALGGPSGGERQILELAIQLKKQGHEVKLYTNRISPDCFPELINQIDIKVIGTSIENIRKRLDSKGKESKFSKFVKLFGEYSNLLIMNKIGKAVEDCDIINCHNFPSEWAAYIAKKRLNKKIVWMCNEPPFWFHHPNVTFFKKIINFPLYAIFDRKAVSKIDKIIVLDNINVKRVQKAYRRNSEIIRSGLDIKPLQTIQAKKKGKALRKKHKIGKSFMLLAVGGFLDLKRNIDSINACSILSKKGLDVKLVIIGIGPLLEESKKYVKDLGIEKNIIFAGRISDDDLAGYYNSCDILLFPAEQTWGLTVIEAMACKKPTITGAKAGVSEIIEQGKNGFIVPSRSPKAIAEKVELLMKNNKLYKSIAKAGYKFIKKNISWQKYGKDMEKVFKQLVVL